MRFKLADKQVEQVETSSGNSKGYTSSRAIALPCTRKINASYLILYKYRRAISLLLRDFHNCGRVKSATATLCRRLKNATKLRAACW